MSNIFQKHLFFVGYSVGLNLNHSTSRSWGVKNCDKNCVSCPYLLKTFLYQFKRVEKTFLVKNSFNCKSSNLFSVVIWQGCKEEYTDETGCLVKERINVCRQHERQLQYQQLAVEELLRTCGDGKFPFLKIIQENKSLKKSYENKVAKPSEVAGSQYDVWRDLHNCT